MRFFAVISVLACGAMALAAAVTPDALVSRGNAGVVSALDTLDNNCDSILPMFDSCQDADCTEKICLELVAVVNVATAACANAKDIISVSLAQKAADIVSKIVVKLDSHKSSCGDKCGDYSVYAQIDLCISLWLQQLGVCVSGILVLVSTLLLNVVLTLKGLSLNLILKVCLFI